MTARSAYGVALQARRASSPRQLGIADADEIDHVHIRTFESGKRIMAGDPTR